MKPYLLLISVIVFMSCKDERHCGVYVGNEKLGLDNYWRKITGYDSLQIFCNAGDKLDYNFCYPNEFNPYSSKSDTIFDAINFTRDSTLGIHYDTDTIYTEQPLVTPYKNKP